MAISLNILALPVPDVPALLDWCAAAKPPYIVVMDSPDIATRVAMVSPTTQIIFRRYRPDDARLHETISPLAFLESVADLPKAWIVQALNEPGGDQQKLADWCAELIGLADVRGRRLALPNWSVGNPDDEMIAAGIYDHLLYALADSGKHLLGLHEYFWNKPAQEPYFVGRYAHFLRRCDEIGIARPEVCVTEHGRDLGGGHDGWRAQGWSEADYADRLEDAQTVYAPDGITACVFCYGRGFDDRWQTYNVEGARELLARMSAMNSGDDEMAYNGPPGWVQVKTGPSGVNVRSAPGLSYAPIAVVKTGDWAKPSGPTTKANGYTWQKISLEDCRTGYVATEVIELGD